MSWIKLTDISCICVGGLVITPDANGLVDVPDEILSSDDFQRVRASLTGNQKIETGEAPVPDVPPVEPVADGKKGKGTKPANPIELVTASEVKPEA
jgi:hypothetical protein